MHNKKYRLNKIKVCLALLCAGISVLASKRSLESLSDSGPSKKLRSNPNSPNDTSLDPSIKESDNFSSSIVLAPQPLQKLFRDIDESSILKVFIYNNNSIIIIDKTEYSLNNDKKEEEARKKLEERDPDIIWIGIKKNTSKYSEPVKFLLSYNSSNNTSYIIQWVSNSEERKKANEELNDKFIEATLSGILYGTHISEYTGQFLLFVDPTSGFLKNTSKINESSESEEKNTKPNKKSEKIFTELYKSLHPLQNYSSIYILYTKKPSTFSTSKSIRKTYQNMYYYLLLHKNIKYYGAVSLHFDMHISLTNLVKTSIAGICLDTLVIYQKYAGEDDTYYFNPFSSLNPLHLDISFNTWKRIKVNCKSSSIELYKLTIRDILLDLSAMSTSSSSQEKKNTLCPFKINSSDCIRDMFRYSYTLHRNLFSISYPYILETDLYFIASASSVSFSFTPTHLCKLFAFAAFYFFNTLYLNIHLLSTYRIDLSRLTNSSEPLTLSESFKDELRRFYTGCIEKSLINNYSIQDIETFLSNPSTKFLDIIFKKSWNSTNYYLDLLFSCIQDLCSIMSSIGYVLVTSNTTTITISNGTQTHVLHTLNYKTPITISFEDKKQLLFFRHFSLLQQQ